MDTVGERIRNRRNELGMTLDALCKRAELSKGFLSDIENKDKGVSAKKLLNIANALNVSLDYLLTGKADQSQPSSIEIPEELVALGQSEDLTFKEMLTLMEMKQQIVAHRSNSKNPASDGFDWMGFYNSVKGWL